MNAATNSCTWTTPSSSFQGVEDVAAQDCAVVGGLVGEHEDRLFDVGEVLVEGRRRRPDLAGDVDDPQAERAALLEQLGGGVEQPPPRALCARAPMTRPSEASAGSVTAGHVPTLAPSRRVI